ncbi:hypothetical protein O6H91_18G014900 [Diphasiastrum complanatum]|uniref:Uncharacterized protein n=1 Tax=Diphasiastrum complanatum TaxID=34168 RepID=A0ACC2AY93_DIPCM|nr:hypothetical protein O6H91_18G014900 [Diphasiastrum complanatum]
MFSCGLDNIRTVTGKQDAMQSYEAVLKIKIDHQAGYNLVVCSYILGNTEKMKASFTKMLLVRHYDPDSDDDIEANDAYMLQIDELLEELKGRQTCAYKYILAAARLIAPVIGASFLEGYDWLIDMLNDQHYTSLAHEIEMDKAIQQLHRGNYGEAILLLKDFERKEKGLKARAATNLSFLYFLEGDISNAQKHAELAVQANSFNACALVNQANCLFSRGDLEGAKVMFLEAIEVEAECVEANYNLGLTYKKLGLFEAALTTFKKLSNWLPSNNDVLFQMGHVNEMMGNFQEAIKWLEILVTKAMHDAGVLAKLGNLYSICNDEAKALHFYNESHRTYPVNIDIVSWLGFYYVKNEVYEKAMSFFELASKIQPHEAKWQLLLASCYRKTGMYTIAFSKYKEILGKHPDNVECLRHLVHMCNSLGKREEVKEYQIRLHKAETNEQTNSRSQPMRLERVEQTAIRMDMKDISRHLFVSENSGQMLDNRTEVVCLPCSFLHGTQQSGRPSTSPSLTVTHQAKERKPAMKNEKIDDGEWELGDDFLPM